MLDKKILDDRIGLTITANILMAIALEGNVRDMKLAAIGVSFIDQELIAKYYEAGERYRDEYLKLLQTLEKNNENPAN